MADATQSRGSEEVTELLRRFVDTYDRGQTEFFDLFAPDATVFTLTSPTRIDGVEEFRRGFEAQLTSGVQRRSQILSPEVRPTGDGALVSFHNRVQIEGTSVNMRASMVLTRGSRGLSISHLHLSPLSAAAGVSSIGGGRALEEVTVLEERVATAISNVGTPK